MGEILGRAGLRSGSVLAIGWGRAIRGILDAGLPPVPGVLVVPATGGMQQQQPHFQVNEFVRLAAEQLGGTPHFIHAPYLPSAATRDAFLADPSIAESVALWDRIDVAPRRHRPAAREELAGGQRRHAGRAGAVQRRRRRHPPLLRCRGPPVDWDGEGRMIAASPDQLRRAPLVIGAAIGVEKADAILGAVRAGFVSALVTDVRTADALLARL